MLRERDDGIEITGEPSRGSVRLLEFERPWDDEILDFKCELTDHGVTAAAWVRTLDGDGLPAWFAELSEAYQGWDDARTWTSLERDARIEARHDGAGYVRLRFVLRGPQGYEPDAWEASVTVVVDAGEDMRTLATRIARLSGRAAG